MSKKVMKIVYSVALVLLIIGGLNLGLSALGLNVIVAVFGSVAALPEAIYVLVGVSAVLIAVKHLFKKKNK